MGKLPAIVGVVFVIIGAIFCGAQRFPFLGKLPGDMGYTPSARKYYLLFSYYKLYYY